jgi:protein-disulfide isomerase-like protein with CxxC motif
MSQAQSIQNKGVKSFVPGPNNGSFDNVQTVRDTTLPKMDATVNTAFLNSVTTHKSNGGLNDVQEAQLNALADGRAVTNEGIISIATQFGIDAAVLADLLDAVQSAKKLVNETSAKMPGVSEDLGNTMKAAGKGSDDTTSNVDGN